MDKNKRIACAGNSSSGLKETPAFNCPTLNIGSRQDSRLRGENVLDSNYDEKTIYEKLKKCLFDNEFRHKCSKAENPYWIGDAGPKIAEILNKTEINQELIRKKMLLEGKIKDGWFR